MQLLLITIIMSSLVTYFGYSVAQFNYKNYIHAALIVSVLLLLLVTLLIGALTSAYMLVAFVCYALAPGAIQAIRKRKRN